MQNKTLVKLNFYSVEVLILVNKKEYKKAA